LLGFKNFAFPISFFFFFFLPKINIKKSSYA